MSPNDTDRIRQRLLRAIGGRHPNNRRRRSNPNTRCATSTPDGTP